VEFSSSRDAFFPPSNTSRRWVCPFSSFLITGKGWHNDHISVNLDPRCLGLTVDSPVVRMRPNRAFGIISPKIEIAESCPNSVRGIASTLKPRVSPFSFSPLGTLPKLGHSHNTGYQMALGDPQAHVSMCVLQVNDIEEAYAAAQRNFSLQLYSSNRIVDK
jgi:hypothetical protein